MDAAVVRDRRTSRRTGRAGRGQTIVVMAITAVFIGALTWVVTDGFNDGVTNIELSGELSAAAPAIGEAPPPFTATTYDGKPVSLADYAGRPVWLTFGASWCADCRAEAADVEATYEQYKGQGLVVLAVFISEPARDIAGYAQRAGLTFPIAVDQTTAIASSYRTLGIPTHYFIGADGRIRDMRIGALHRDDMTALVTALMR